MTVFKKLLEVQSKLKAPKSQYNSFGKYAYRNCEDILESLKPILTEVKATVFISDDIINIEGRFYVKSTVTFVDVETGEQITNSALAREEETKKGMDGSQITGSSSSYARKYALNGMFAIDDTKDSDTTNTHGKEDNKKNKEELTESQIKRLYAIANKANITPAQVATFTKKSYNKVDVKTLTKAEYDEVCNKLEEKAKQ